MTEKEFEDYVSFYIKDMRKSLNILEKALEFRRAGRYENAKTASP